MSVLREHCRIGPLLRRTDSDLCGNRNQCSPPGRPTIGRLCPLGTRLSGPSLPRAGSTLVWTGRGAASSSAPALGERLSARRLAHAALSSDAVRVPRPAGSPSSRGKLTTCPLLQGRQVKNLPHALQM